MLRGVVQRLAESNAEHEHDRERDQRENAAQKPSPAGTRARGRRPIHGV
jgi:hypothetical protein